jgi:hypothetical protein
MPFPEVSMDCTSVGHIGSSRIVGVSTQDIESEALLILFLEISLSWNGVSSPEHYSRHLHRRTGLGGRDHIVAYMQLDPIIC